MVFVVILLFALFWIVALSEIRSGGPIRDGTFLGLTVCVLGGQLAVLSKWYARKIYKRATSSKAKLTLAVWERLSEKNIQVLYLILGIIMFIAGGAICIMQ